jgi:hypothetical protein
MARREVYSAPEDLNPPFSLDNPLWRRRFGLPAEIGEDNLEYW